ncbi:MAG: hypothetical protein ACYCOX_14420 [Acidobacteriaceae bacterium]
MKAKSSLQNIQSIEAVDLAPMAPKLKGLFFNIERELERKANENPGHRCSNQATIFLLVSTLSMYNCYATIVWLGSDVEETGKRPKNTILTIPSVTRTMVDILFTIVFMFDQEKFLPNYMWYAKSSYREATEELQRYKRDFPQHKDYINFFESELKEYALGLKQHLQVTDAEISNPSQLARWPTLTKVIDPRQKYAKNLSAACKEFFVWLNDWSYREISQVAHHSAWGVSKIGSFLMKDSLSKEMQNRIDGDSIHRFRFGQISSALTVLLCFASEINQHYRLGHNEELLLIWQYFNKVPMIQEAWAERYKQFLST